jgi:hypothetical protein
MEADNVFCGYEGDIMNTVLQTLIAIKAVEEKFAKIQENPALNGSENGLSNEEQALLEKLTALCGEVNLAGDAIIKRILPR